MTSSPSPAPAYTSASITQGTKARQTEQTRLKTDAIFSQPKETGAGNTLISQITYAVKHLMEKGLPMAFRDLISYLSLLHLTDSQLKVFERALRDNPSVSFDPAGLDGKGCYTFKSRYDIHDSSQLLAYLQNLPTFQGLPASDLIEGWSTSEAAIRELQEERKLLVLRSRKDDKAKMVWLDDPSLSHPIDAEFRDMWAKIKLPDPEKTAAELELNGLVPTSKSKKLKTAPKVQGKKQRRTKKTAKFTNQHIEGILRDYSQGRK